MTRRCCGTLATLLLVSYAWAGDPTPVPDELPTLNQPAYRPTDSTPCDSVQVPQVPFLCSSLALTECTADSSRTDRAWFEGEYLLWWFRDGNLPIPVATTSNPASLGIIGVGDTRIVRGNEQFNYGPVNGLRVTSGLWFDNKQNFGIEGSAFLFERRQDGFTLNSVTNNLPLLARPFFDTTLQLQNSKLIAFPGGSRGEFDVISRSRLWGAEVNGLSQWATEGGLRVIGLGGFRYLDLAEDLQVFDSSNLFSPLVTTSFNRRGTLAPAVTGSADRFSTRNQFYGGQVGALLGYSRGLFGVDLTGKVALGGIHQVVSRDGTSTLVGTGTVAGGVLVLSSNRGRIETDQFAVVPEVSIKFRIQLTKCAAMTVGYSYLFVSSVVRPGDQMDAALNPTLIPVSPTFGQTGGAIRPSPLFNRGSFDAHGLTAGLNLSY